VPYLKSKPLFQCGQYNKGSDNSLLILIIRFMKVAISPILNVYSMRRQCNHTCLAVPDVSRSIEVGEVPTASSLLRENRLLSKYSSGYSGEDLYQWESPNFLRRRAEQPKC
jgi:hypothetical protein